jgi:serine/threonine protein kinase
VYSLGVLMFALRTGMVPYTENLTSLNMKKLLKLAVDRSDEFWDEHNNVSGQQNTFSKEFKELFWRLTELHPTKRLSLEKVKEHSWLKGEMYTQEETKRLLE